MGAVVFRKRSIRGRGRHNAQAESHGDWMREAGPEESDQPERESGQARSTGIRDRGGLAARECSGEIRGAECLGGRRQQGDLNELEQVEVSDAAAIEIAGGAFVFAERGRVGMVVVGVRQFGGEGFVLFLLVMVGGVRFRVGLRVVVVGVGGAGSRLTGGEHSGFPSMAQANAGDLLNLHEGDEEEDEGTAHEKSLRGIGGHRNRRLCMGL